MDIEKEVKEQLSESRTNSPTGKRKKDGDGEDGTPLRGSTVEAPLLPLGERVLPERWLNIPSCLVKAFQDDIANQEYLEALSW